MNIIIIIKVISYVIIAGVTKKSIWVDFDPGGMEAEKSTFATRNSDAKFKNNTSVNFLF